MRMKRSWKPRNIHPSNTLLHVACKNKDVKFGSTFGTRANKIKSPRGGVTVHNIKVDGGLAPLINLSIGWGECLALCARRSTPRGKARGAYPLTSKMGGAQRRYGILRRRKSILSVLGVESKLPEYPVLSLVAISSQQFQLTAKTLTSA